MEMRTNSKAQHKELYLTAAAHSHSNSAKIQHYLYETWYQFSSHNKIVSSTHCRISHKMKLVAHKSPPSAQNKPYFQSDSLQNKHTGISLQGKQKIQ